MQGTRSTSAWLLFLGASALAVPHAHAQSDGSLPDWRLSPQPTLLLNDNGTADRQFFVVVGTARSANGQIAVANFGSLEVRVFDGDGTLVARHGRKGQGPGEFERMSWLGRQGDTLLLYDNALRRVSRVAFNGGVVSSYQLAPKNAHQEGTSPVGVFPSGRLLVVPNTPSRMARPHGLTRDTVSFGVFDPDTDSITLLPAMPRFTSLVINPSNAPRALARGVYPFGPQLHHEVVGESVWFADSHEDYVTAYYSSGRKTARISLPLPSERYDEAAFARARARAFDLASTDQSRRMLEYRYDPKFRGRFQPRHGRLISARDGNVWIERFRMSEAEPASYVIVDRAGRPLATASVPAGFAPFEVGSDYVLGTTRDELGAEAVAMYRLLRQ